MTTSRRLLTRAERAILGRAFAAEIRQAVEGTASHLLRSRLNLCKKLVTQGLLREVTHHVGNDRVGAISLTGYELTHAGRLAYCLGCEEELVGVAS